MGMVEVCGRETVMLRFYSFTWPPNAYEIGTLKWRLGVQFPMRQERGWHFTLTPAIGVGHNDYCLFGFDFEWLVIHFNVYVRRCPVEEGIANELR